MTSNTQQQRKLVAQYTTQDRDVQRMSDHEFYDYAAFLVQQQDVNALEPAKEAIETTKNFRNIRTLSEARSAVNTVSIVVLFSIVAFVLVVAIVYYMYFDVWKGDHIKGKINKQIFINVLCVVLVFFMFYFLFHSMSVTLKKIMSLL